VARDDAPVVAGKCRRAKNMRIDIFLPSNDSFIQVFEMQLPIAG